MKTRMENVNLRGSKVALQNSSATATGYNEAFTV